jgi:hypothetical protein
MMADVRAVFALNHFLANRKSFIEETDFRKECLSHYS